MPKHTPRWSWLAVFAACNLAFWLAVAIAVGVTATDLVDLGIESFLRQKQATVIAVQVAGLSKQPSSAPPPTSVVALEPTATPAVMQTATDVVGSPSANPPAASESTPAAPSARMTPYASRTPSAPPPPANPTAQPRATAASSSQPAGPDPLPRRRPQPGTGIRPGWLSRSAFPQRPGRSSAWSGNHLWTGHDHGPGDAGHHRGHH